MSRSTVAPAPAGSYTTGPLPLRLASYIAVSACLSSVVGSRPWSGNKAMPTLVATCSGEVVKPKGL